MHLLPPQPEITLYEDGFDINDILNRATIGKDLSNLIERIEDPLVVALDGPWGSGKSHFLKRWVGAHCKDNGGTATTVYFDAFKSDFLDDPLIALTGAIAEKLENGAQRSRWQQAKTAAVKLYRPALRIGLAAATGGISEYTGAVLDAAVAASSKEAEQAAEAFWRREDGRKAAMQQFTDALTKLTQGEGNEDPGKPLVIVIDELDRCRPDYALATLEVIKHFFAVPRVHFVLGVNLEALGHIVRSRYGAEVNAQEYLKRFFTLSIELPDEVPGDRSIRAELKYFASTAQKMNLPDSLINEATRHLKLSIPASQISLRDIEKILSSIALSSAVNDGFHYPHGIQKVFTSLALFRVKRPDLFRAAFDGSLQIEQVKEFYGIREEMIENRDRLRRSPSFNPDAYTISGLWSCLVTGNSNADGNGHFSSAFDTFGDFNAKDIYEVLKREFFGSFKLPD